MKTFEPKSVEQVYAYSIDPIVSIEKEYNKLLTAYTTLQTELAQVRKEREWVSVADRLPEIGQGVLICLNTKLITIAYRKIHGKSYDWQMFGDIKVSLVVSENDFVTHWMPLPAAPDNLK